LGLPLKRHCQRRYQISDYREIAEIGIIGKKIIPGLRIEKTCGVMSGSRPFVESDDFVIRPSSKDSVSFTAGISSPGLSAAPAIARQVILYQGSNQAGCQG
jgi:glycerol-3-phosphate dehydrogenase